MPEIAELTVKVNIDNTGLESLESEFSKTADSMSKSGEKISSTFESICEDITVLSAKMALFQEFSKGSFDGLKSGVEGLNTSLQELCNKLNEIISKGDVFQAANQSGKDFCLTLKDVCNDLERVTEKLDDLGLKGVEQSEALSPLEQRFENIKTRFSSYIDDIKASKNPLDQIILGFLGLGQVIFDLGALIGLGFTFNEIIKNFESIKNSGIVKFFTDLFAAVRNSSAFKALSDTIGNLATRIKGINFSGILKSLGSLFTLVGRSTAFQTFLSVIGRIALVIGGVLSVKVLAIIAIIGGLIFAIVKAIEHWDAIKEAIGRFVSFAGERLTAFGEFIGEKFTQFFEFISGVWDAIAERAGQVWEVIKGVVGTAIDGIKEFFAGIGTTLSEVWDSAGTKATEVWDGIKTTVSGAVESIKEFGTDIKDSIVNSFSNAFDSVKNFIPEKIKSIKEGITNFNLGDFISGGGDQSEIQQNQPTPTPGPSTGQNSAENVSQLNDEVVKLNKTIQESGFIFDENGVRILSHNELLKNSTASNELNAGSAIKIVESNQQLNKSVEDVEKTLGNQKDQIVEVTQSTDDATISQKDYVQQNLELLEANSQLPVELDQTAGALDNVGESASNAEEKLEDLEPDEGFFGGIKQGFEDFVESVGTNSELIANFFANTLSQISENFSDLLFNVFKGNFDSLSDLAGQAFDSILKSFLDLVSAIATRQIVVSIGGLFGLGGGAAAAGGVKDKTEENTQNVIFLDEIREKREEFRLAA